MDEDYDPVAIDTFQKLKEKFVAFGGVLLEAKDEERFYVAFKCLAKRYPEEETLFNELCSHALNGNRIVDMQLLERLESEVKPMEVIATPPPISKKPQIINTAKRNVLKNMSNFTPPKAPRFLPLKQMKKPDSPVSLEPKQFTGGLFGELNINLEPEPATLFIRKLPNDLFYYGRRFDGEELSTVSIDEQIAGQLGTDEDPEKKIILSGRLLIKKNEGGDDMIMLKNGLSSIQLDISALENFSYFHGMVADFYCVPISSSILKAVKFVKPDQMPLAPLNGMHGSLRIILSHGPFFGNGETNLLDVLADKAILSKVHALILSGPFYDPADKLQFTALSKQNFVNLCSKLGNSRINVIIAPNATQDLLSMQVFPTPALKPSDFGFTDEAALPSNIFFVTDPGIFDLNGVRFAMTSSQALFMLSRCERYQGSSQGDRMLRMCEHVLEQRSLAPVQLQASQILHEQFQPHLSERPHFVIAPSNLVPMMKSVQNVAFINSRYCTKNSLRYATIDVNLQNVRKNEGTSETNILDYSNITLHAENL